MIGRTPPVPGGGAAGRDRFELAVSLSVLAASIHRLGRILRDRERLRLDRRKRAA